MRTLITLILFTILAGTMPQAMAGEASFRVGATVVSGHGSGPLLQALPHPVGSQAMATTARGTHHAFPGTMQAAGDFYRQAMPLAGYSLVSEHAVAGTGHVQQVWNNGGRQVVVDLDAALGSLPATRISLQGSATGLRTVVVL